MIQLITFLVIAFCCLSGCYLSFSDCETRWWYLFAGVGLSMVHALAWYLGVKLIGDKSQVYVFGLLCDALLILVYYVMPPLLWSKIEVTKTTIAGIGFVLAGMALIKLGEYVKF